MGYLPQRPQTRVSVLSKIAVLCVLMRMCCVALKAAIGSNVDAYCNLYCPHTS